MTFFMTLWFNSSNKINIILYVQKHKVHEFSTILMMGIVLNVSMGYNVIRLEAKKAFSQLQRIIGVHLGWGRASITIGTHYISNTGTQAH